MWKSIISVVCRDLMVQIFFLQFVRTCENVYVGRGVCISVTNTMQKQFTSFSKGAAL